MSEMNIQEQIKAIDEVMEYMDQVKRDITYLNEKVSEKLAYLRQNGLRTEFTELVNSKYMGHINDELGKVMDNMEYGDKQYLIRVKEHLVRAGNEL